MENRIFSVENQCSGGEPQRIGDILAELMSKNRFPAASIVQTPSIMEDQSCLYYPAELANVS